MIQSALQEIGVRSDSSTLAIRQEGSFFTCRMSRGETQILERAAIRPCLGALTWKEELDPEMERRGKAFLKL
jgi:hypothetical protein